MAIQVFNNQDQLDETALVLVSRFVFDSAVSVIMQGNVADESQQVLSYLVGLSRSKNIPKKSIDVIDFYLSQVADQNDEMLSFR